MLSSRGRWCDWNGEPALSDPSKGTDTKKKWGYQTKNPRTPHSQLWPAVHFHVLIPKEILKNDEEPARHEEGEAKPPKEMLPDKDVGDTLDNTFIFLPFSWFLVGDGGEHTCCLSSLLFSSPILWSSFCKWFCVTQRQMTAVSKGTKRKIDNREISRWEKLLCLSTLEYARA